MTKTRTMTPARTAGRGVLAVLLVAALVVGLGASPTAASGHGKGQRKQRTSQPAASQPTITSEPTTGEPVEVYDPAAALGSLYNVVDQINARALWHAGVTGDGVDVAVIDTGVAPVPALTGADKVVAMVDLSFEADVAEATYLDTFGHGTHMTGIIAGRDPDAYPTTAHTRPDEFLGVAPDAGIVSVKVGDNTGAVDVSQVIAAIDWVIEHRTAGDLNIRVINLSYGTDSRQDYRIDPLARAVERAWEHGIVVVAASGNDGWNHSTGGMTNPAKDPYVIAVSAAKATDHGMTIPRWASAGDYWSYDDDGRKVHYWEDGFTGRLPDVIAPGAHIVSLRVPGSRVATEHPEGYVTDLLLRGSGTSQAAAVVSGAAALLVDHRPDLTPDQVKALLRTTAEPLERWPVAVQGQGLIDVAKAARTPAPHTVQTWEPSTGLGSLEAARGTQHITINGHPLAGETTAFGSPWNPQAWIDATTTGVSWTGASWTGASWTGASWTGASWTGASWTGVGWS